LAAQVNQSNEDIGARRLHTIMEKLLEEISFEAPEMKKRVVSNRRRLRTAATYRYRERPGSEQVHPLMRFGYWLFRRASNGCGYVGDPLPPR
jgi:hypothetical protein